MKKTLLIAASAPGLNGVGGFLIDQMLNVDGVEAVSLAGIIPETSAANANSDRLKAIEFFPPCDEWYTHQSHSITGSIKKLYRHRTAYDQHIRMLADLIDHYALSQQPDQLWLILNSLATIDLAYRLAKRFDGEIITQIWDDPSHLCRQRSLDRFSRNRTRRRFQQLLKHSTRIGVICKQARQAYQTHSDAPIVIVRHGIADRERIVRNRPNDTSIFRIGLAGSMYATDAWESFQQSLDQVNWSIDGRRIELVVAAKKITFTSDRHANATFHGWRDQTELQAILSDCDCLYLPQPFSNRSKELAELSFPTKLSTYVSTGRPIFVHVPPYGSVNRFCQRHQFGIVCQSLAPDNILASIRPLIENTRLLDDQSKASKRISENVLTYQSFATATRQMLGIEDVH